MFHNKWKIECILQNDGALTNIDNILCIFDSFYTPESSITNVIWEFFGLNSNKLEFIEPILSKIASQSKQFSEAQIL